MRCIEGRREQKGSVIVINHSGGGGGGGNSDGDSTDGDSSNSIGRCGNGNNEATTIVKMNPKKGNTIIVKGAGSSGKKKKQQETHEQMHVPVPVPIPIHIDQHHHSGHQIHGHQMNHASSQNIPLFALRPHQLIAPSTSQQQTLSMPQLPNMMMINHHLTQNTNRRASIDFPVFVKDESNTISNSITNPISNTLPIANSISNTISNGISNSISTETSTASSSSVPVFVKDSSPDPRSDATNTISVSVDPMTGLNVNLPNQIHLPVFTSA